MHIFLGWPRSCLFCGEQVLRKLYLLQTFFATKQTFVLRRVSVALSGAPREVSSQKFFRKDYRKERLLRS